jgi:Capsule polysaccharide biosynthesis protein.
MKIKVIKTIEQLRKELSSDFIIFGASEGFERLVELLECFSIKYKIEYLCDNDEKKWNNKIRNNLIKNPSELKLIDKNKKIVISSQYIDEIAFQLESYGLKNCYAIDENLIKNKSLLSDIYIIKSQIDCMIDEDNIIGKQKILYAMSFAIHKPCKVHDFILAQALRLRGCSIIPLVCDGIQENQCNVYGGIWGRYDLTNCNHEKIKCENCEHCIKESLELWEEWCGINPILLSRYLMPEDKIEVREVISKLDVDNYKEWIFDEMPIGQWCIDVIANNEMVGNIEVVSNYKSQLKEYSFNIILLIKVIDRILRDNNPDIIISNDSYYYQWAIVEQLAKRKRIPFYSQWSGGRKGGWCYAKDDAAMNINLDKTWSNFKNLELNNNEKVFINKYLSERKIGADMVLNTANPNKNSDILIDDNKDIDFSKPTALLATNIIWDLSALNKDVVFSDMISWIMNTIEFFKKNKNYQLIIKSHPGEKNKNVPDTKQQIGHEIKKRYDKLPDNIIWISPNSKYSVYDLFDKVKLGLIYTSTVGLELACKNIPVILVAKPHYYNKGFTIEPKSKEDYYDFISKVLCNNRYYENNITEQLAKKYFYLFIFKYYMSLYIFDYSFSGETKLIINNATELLKGKNKILDYICESIIEHKDIFNEERWTP